VSLLYILRQCACACIYAVRLLICITYFTDSIGVVIKHVSQTSHLNTVFFAYLHTAVVLFTNVTVVCCLTRNTSATSILTQMYAFSVASIHTSLTLGLQPYPNVWRVRLMIIDHDRQFLGTFTSITVYFILCEDDAALQNSTVNT